MVIIYKNLEFGQNVRKISIFDKSTGNSWFWSKLTKMSILDKIAENVDYSQIFSKNVDLGKKLPKISILVKVFESIDFGEKCQKNPSNLVKFVEQSRFWTKLSKILDFGQDLKKCRFWSKYKKMFILVKIIKKTLTLVKILNNSRFW